jgi:hypothetical protein
VNSRPLRCAGSWLGGCCETQCFPEIVARRCRILNTSSGLPREKHSMSDSYKEPTYEAEMLTRAAK